MKQAKPFLLIMHPTLDLYVNLGTLLCYAPTSALHDVIDGPIVDSSVTGFNIQKRLVAHSHRHHLLHTDLCADIRSNHSTTEIQKLGQQT